jgi:hypothetical protein
MKVTIEWENGQKHICTMPKPNFMVDNIEKKMISKILIESGQPLSLTDEEIMEVGNAVTNLIDSNEGWIEFARAILRKAQEKSNSSICKHGFDLSKCRCPKCEAGID